jgi:hypothetical protein
MYHYLFIFLGFVPFFLFLYKKLIRRPETYIPETNHEVAKHFAVSQTKQSTSQPNKANEQQISKNGIRDCFRFHLYYQGLQT